MDSTWAVIWAALGGTISAVLLKLIEWLMSRGSESRQARINLSDEISKLWARLDERDKEIERLRDDGAARDESHRQRIETLEAALATLRREHAELQREHAELQREYAELQARLPAHGWEKDGIA